MIYSPTSMETRQFYAPPLSLLSTVFLATTLVISGCDFVQREPTKHSGTQRPQEKRQEFESQAAVASVLATCLFVLPDTTLSATVEVPMGGDLRPIWRVSGRVRNICPREMTNVTFLIQVLKKSDAEQLDTAEFTLNGSIAPNATRGIEENVRLRMATKGWTWSAVPIRGQVGPVQ